MSQSYRGIMARSIAGTEFNPDGGQFRARLVFDMVQPAGAAIPIAGVAQVAFDFVQHGMNPRGGGVILVLLDPLMRGIPLSGQSQFHRLEQIIVWGAHGLCSTAKPARRQDWCMHDGKSRPHAGRADNLSGGP